MACVPHCRALGEYAGVHRIPRFHEPAGGDLQELERGEQPSNSWQRYPKRSGHRASSTAGMSQAQQQGNLLTLMSNQCRRKVLWRNEKMRGVYGS